MRRSISLAIAAVALLLVLAFCQAASNQELTQKLNRLVNKANQMTQENLKGKVSQRILNRLSGAIQKAEAAKQVIAKPTRPLFENKLSKKLNKKWLNKKQRKQQKQQEEAFADSMSMSALSNGDQLRATAALNVRSGPCTTYGVVRSLAAGQTVGYTGQSSSGCGYTWYSISGGWVASAFVQVISSGPSNGDSLQATDALNVRAGPCTSHAVVRSLAAGQTASYTGQTATGCGYTWYSISGGWVASAFVRVIGGGGGGGGGLLSLAQLRAVMPNLSTGLANEYIGHLNNAMEWGSITTCPRKAAFLAQLAHESAEFRYMEEIASGDAYEGRKDLGNIYPGDGRRYKGRGPIQLTGRNNYRAAGRDLGVDLEGNPTLAATPAWGFKVAAWYWKTRSLNQYADQNTQAGFDAVTLRINGGYNGKADRDKYWYRAKSVLGC